MLRIQPFALATAVTAVGVLGCLGGAPARADSVALPDSASKIRPLLIGAEAPDVTLGRADGSAFGLKQAIEKQPAIVIFYRGGW